MDKIDREILKFLQQNGLESARLLSTHLQIGQRAIQRRIKIMRDKGLFKLIAVPNLISLGYEGWAKIGINADPPCLDRIAKVLAYHPSVHLVVHAIGPYNLIIAVAFETLEMLTNFISCELNDIDGIKSKETMVFTHPIKYYRYHWPDYKTKDNGSAGENLSKNRSDKYRTSALEKSILGALMLDGPTNPGIIKEKIKISEYIIRNRINFMKNNHLITFEVVPNMPNMQLLEGEAQASVDISTTNNFNFRQLDEIIKDPSIYLVSFCLGRFDLEIIVRCDNIDSLSQFINTKLGAIEGIGSIQTSLHCRFVKFYNNIMDSS